MTLYDDYGSLSGSKHYKAELDRLKKIASKLNLITRLKIAIYSNDEKLIQKLAGSANLKTAEGMLKIWLSEYEQLANNSAATETTNAGFESTLVEISKHMGFRIDAKIVTVAEFASMINNYNKELEYQKKSLKS
jgi:hypothetical protein